MENPKIGQTVLAFNSVEWSKTGDLKEGNDIYFQKVKVVKLRKCNRGRDVADVIYLKTGKKSNGHFLSALKEV